MANFTSVYFFEALALAQINLDTDTLLMLLCDNTCTVTETNKFLTNVTTLGEITGSGYTRKTLTNTAVVVDEVNKKVTMTADPVDWASLDVAQQPAMALIVKDGAGDNARLILARYDDGGFPFPAAGGVPVSVRPHVTDGFIKIKKGV